MQEINYVTLGIFVFQLVLVIGFVALLGVAITRLTKATDLSPELRGLWLVAVLFIPFFGAIAFLLRPTTGAAAPPSR